MPEYNSKRINEQITTGDIGSTEFWMNVSDRFQQTQIPSLAHSLLAVYSMKSPLGKVFNLTDSDGDVDDEVELKLAATTIEAKSTKPYRIAITPEALDDYTSMYRDPAQAIANSLRGFTNRKESEDVIAMFNANAADDGELVFTDKFNAETQMFELTGKVQRAVLRMNSNRLRTYHAFAVVPYKYAASVMTTYAYTTGTVTAEASELKIAKFGMMAYYVNPNLSDDYVYVGLKHPNNRALCSGVYGEYQNKITTALDPDSGILNIHIHRRYGMGMSPLHTPEEPMLCKFKISGLD